MSNSENQTSARNMLWSKFKTFTDDNEKAIKFLFYLIGGFCAGVIGVISLAKTYVFPATEARIAQIMSYTKNERKVIPSGNGTATFKINCAKPDDQPLTYGFYPAAGNFDAVSPYLRSAEELQTTEGSRGYQLTIINQAGIERLPGEVVAWLNCLQRQK